MAFNQYGGGHFGPPQNFNPYTGASHQNLAPPPGMSPVPGMLFPPGISQPPNTTHTNRPSGLGSAFQPPPNLPNINYNAPVIRLGSATSGGTSLPPRSNLSAAPYNRRDWDTDTPISAASNTSGLSIRSDFRHDRFDSAGGAVIPGNSGINKNTVTLNADGVGGVGVGAGGFDQSRIVTREGMNLQGPPTNDDKLRTIFVYNIPPGVGDKRTLEKLLGVVGQLRYMEAHESHLAEHQGELFAFAQYEDAESVALAVELLADVTIPLMKQKPYDPSNRENILRAKDDWCSSYRPDGSASQGQEASTQNKRSALASHEKVGSSAEDTFNNLVQHIERAQLQVAYDPVTLEYVKIHQEKISDIEKAEAKSRHQTCKSLLRDIVFDLFFPPQVDKSQEMDTEEKTAQAGSDSNTEAVNITASQEDELSDIPADMREIVASEIASFRERSTQRDFERLKREQELEEMERRRNGEENARLTSFASPSAALDLRYKAHGDTLPSRNKTSNAGDRHHQLLNHNLDDPDTDASDEELFRRECIKQQADENKLYQEAERKWTNRERQRAAALEREKDREHTEAENEIRYREEQLARDRAWDDEKELNRKTVVYYRDHAAWLRKRANERAEEDARDEADRRAERMDSRKEAAEVEAARGLADSFLERHAEELRRDETKTITVAKDTAPQRVTISFGAAAQRNQAQRGGVARRTVADVEGLLDNEEQEGSSKRQLVPIQFEPMTASAKMSDEELNHAVRALAQEIPTKRSGLWEWPVYWEYLDDAMLRDKLRPFVEKKVVEYLGVQEQFLVEVVETHLRAHGSPQALVEELQEALDEAAEDLVKKLWRMVIFFTESEKRGLPA